MVDPSSAAAGPQRIALAHDWLCGRRGGEMVLERIAALVRSRFQPAGIYTMFDDGRALAPEVDRLPHHVSALSPLERAGLRRWALPLYPAAVAQLSRRLARDHARLPIDLLISSSSAAIKGLRSPAGVPHLCYCHCPARYLWSLEEDYAKGSGLRAAGLRFFGPSLRRWDARTSAHVSAFVANSSHTQAEIARCYGRESVVIHPPVRTEFFTPDPGVWREDFWLIIGALEPYKRVDAAILAAGLQRRRLVIVGGGSEEPRLRKLAAGMPNVEFLGRRTDDEVRDLYRRARVLLFPQVEDFGIVAVEAQSCGLPVAARGSGGALDSITARTGSFFEEPDPAAIARAAEAAADQDGAECRRNAERFSEERFDTAMLDAIRGALGLQRDSLARPV